jgi:RND family efflux transporter MFP subunit
MRILISTALFAILALGGAQRVEAQTEPTIIRATTAPSDTRRLGFDIRGVVRKLDVERGDAVKSGQRLMSLDDTEERARLDFANRRADVTQQVAEADARVQLAEVELARAREAVKATVGTQLEVDRTEAEMKIARARLAQAKHEGQVFAAEAAAQQARVERFSLYTPMDGFIEEIIVKAGENVDESRPVINVVDIDPLHVEVRLLETQQVQQLRVGQSLEVRYPNGNWTPAKVDFIGKVGDARSGTLLFRLEWPNPGLVPAGQAVEVRVPAAAVATGN